MFAVYVVMLLWVTLLSRIGDDTRHFFPPFWSFKEIMNGSVNALWETIGNIIMFIPLGIGLRYLTGWRREAIILCGFCVASIIEFAQWCFWLGSSELDDVITNTLGTVIGTVLIKPRSKTVISKKTMILSLVACVVMVSFPLLGQEYRHIRMTQLASLFDRADGTKNILVLNAEPGYVGESDVYVSYSTDGSIRISGSSETVGYKLIGRITLDPGDYTFTGFTGVTQNTIGIYLEKFNGDGFYRFTPDLGPTESTHFTLLESERVRVYVKVYPGASGEYTARPAIYREE